MSLTLKRFAQNPLKLASNLSINEKSLLKYFYSLESFGLIKVEGSKTKPTKITVLKDQLHLPQESYLQASYAARMRLKALEQMEKLPEGEAYRFSAVFSADSKNA